MADKTGNPLALYFFYLIHRYRGLVVEWMLTFYNAFTETGATKTMKTNQMAELKQ